VGIRQNHKHNSLLLKLISFIRIIKISILKIQLMMMVLKLHLYWDLTLFLNLGI